MTKTRCPRCGHTFTRLRSNLQECDDCGQTLVINAEGSAHQAWIASVDGRVRPEHVKLGGPK